MECDGLHNKNDYCFNNMLYHTELSDKIANEELTKGLGLDDTATDQNAMQHVL